MASERGIAVMLSQIARSHSFLSWIYFRQRNGWICCCFRATGEVSGTLLSAYRYSNVSLLVFFNAIRYVKPMGLFMCSLAFTSDFAKSDHVGRSCESQFILGCQGGSRLPILFHSMTRHTKSLCRESSSSTRNASTSKCRRHGVAIVNLDSLPAGPKRERTSVQCPTCQWVPRWGTLIWCLAPEALVALASRRT